MLEVSEAEERLAYAKAALIRCCLDGSQSNTEWAKAVVRLHIRKTYWPRPHDYIPNTPYTYHDLALMPPPELLEELARWEALAKDTP